MEYLYLINVFISLVLIGYAFRINSILIHIAIIFAYLSLHYTYGIYPFFLNPYKAFDVFVLMHANRNAVIPLVGLGTLCVLFTITFIKYRLNTVLSFKQFCLQRPVNYYVILLFLWLAVSAYYLLSGLSTTNVYPSKLIIVLSLMFVSGLLISYFINCAYSLGVKTQEISHSVSLCMFLTVIIFAVGMYEFLTHRTWVCCTWVRPSSLLFNPNNLALWYVSVIMLFFASKVHGIANKASNLGLVLASIGLFITGSRSIFLGMVFFFAVVAILALFFNKKTFKQLFMAQLWVSVPFLMLCILPHFLIHLSSNQFFIDLQKQANRFLFMFPIIYNYFFEYNVSEISSSSVVKEYFGAYTAADSGVNLIDTGGVNLADRMSSNSTDNGFLHLFLALPRELFMLCTLFMSLVAMTGLQFIYEYKSLLMLVLLSGYFALLASGMAINIFMIFPDWVMLSFILGFILAKKTIKVTNNKVLYAY